jgi:hypothetical protein
MSTSAASTTEPAQCPCGMPQEYLREFKLVGEGGVCTAWRKGSNKQVRCGELFVDHPTTGTILLFLPITLFIFLFLSASFPVTYTF